MNMEVLAVIMDLIKKIWNMIKGLLSKVTAEKDEEEVVSGE